jgi:hypothetical protein
LESEPYSDVWVFAFEQEQAPDADGQATFYLQAQVRELLGFDLPDLAESGVHVAPTVSRRYKIYYGEKLATNEVFIAEFYHEDVSGGGPDYLAWLDLPEPLDASGSFAAIAETSDSSLTDQIAARLGGSSELFSTQEVQNNVVECRMTSADLAYDEIRIPAYVKVTLYQSPVTYTLA